MSIQIRKARAIDAADLTELIRGLGLVPWAAADSQAEIEKRISGHLSLCLQDDSHSIYLAHAPGGTLLGYGAVHWLPYLIFADPEGFVSELFVREDSRGQGIGTRLLEAVKAEAVQRRCGRLMLLNLRDRESYHRGFYLKCGWEERGGAANFVFRFPAHAPDPAPRDSPASQSHESDTSLTRVNSAPAPRKCD